VILAVSLLAGVFMGFRSCPAGSATGEIRSSGKPHGDFVVRPVTCVSGGHWGFDGVWVTPEVETSHGRRGFRGGLKIVETEPGHWEAYQENPHACQIFECQKLLVDRQHCRVYDLFVSDMSVWLRYAGHARLDCSFPEGGTLEADLSFHGCAAVPPPSDGVDP
jgi:hypothetical protein